jgi:hypothetical protein
MTYEEADNKACQLVNDRVARIVFVTQWITFSGDNYDISTHNIPFAIPIKRYLRDSRGFITCKAVTDWRRN